MNTVIMMGRLTKDPEIRSTATGMQVASFTLAVNRRFAKEEPKADFFNVTAWKQDRRFVGKVLYKGSARCLFRADLKTAPGKTQELRGTRHIAENVEFADSKKEDKEEWKQTSRLTYRTNPNCHFRRD